MPVSLFRAGKNQGGDEPAVRGGTTTGSYFRLRQPDMGAASFSTGIIALSPRENPAAALQ